MPSLPIQLFSLPFTVRTLSTAQGRTMRPGRAICRTPNGDTFVAVVDYTSSTTTSLYLYQIPGGVIPATLTGPITSYTLETVISGRGNRPRVAMTCDSLGDLHIVASYSTSANNIGVKYMKYILSAGAGHQDTPATITVITPTAPALDRKVDIDIANSGAASTPVITVTTRAPTLGSGTIDYFSIVSNTVHTITSSSCSGSSFFNVAAFVTCPNSVAAVHTTQALISGVQGMGFWYFLFNTDDSLEMHYLQVGIDGSNPTDYNLGTPFLGMPESIRMFTSNSTPGAEEMTLFADYLSNSNGHLVRYMAGPISLAPVFSNTSIAHGISTVGDSVGMHVMPNRDTFVVAGLSGTQAGIRFVDLTGNVVKVVGNSPRILDTTITAVDNVYGGCNRLIDEGSGQADFLVHQASGGSGKFTYIPIRQPGWPVSIIPAAGSDPTVHTIVNTAVPALSATVGLNSHGDQSDYTVTWQFALDATFTTGVITTVSDWALSGTFAKTLETINKLTNQGPWYLRVKTTNRFGIDSPWKGSFLYMGLVTTYNSLNVTHPPIALPLSPTNGGHLTAGPGVQTFSFAFSDSSAPATMTGYQLQISTSTSEFDVVEDSGVVTSTDPTYTSSLWSTGLYVNQPMYWRVSVIDDDGVQGDYSAWQLVTVLTPPSPVITNPTTGSTVTTSLLNIEWTSGVDVGKTQKAFRVAVQNGSTLVYDSGTLLGDDTSLTLPFGTIHNGESYIVTVFVTDSDGITGATLATFTVALVLPAAPSSITIFSYMYSRLGFIWVGWDNSAVDVDFAAWNVYRRAAGDTNFSLVATVTLERPFYGVPDEQANSNTTYTYCVTQVVNRDGLGDFIESAFTATATVMLAGDYYWLVDSEGLLTPIAMHNATSDSYTDETERTVLTVIGAGRHVDEGEHLGLNGTVTSQLRDHANGLLPATNVLRDPSFQDNQPFSSQWQMSSTGSVSFTNTSFIEACPLTYSSFVRIISEIDTSVLIKQVSIGPPVFQQYDVFNASIWLADMTMNFAFQVIVNIDYYDSSDSYISTSTVILDEVDDLGGNGNWKRFASPFFVGDSGIGRIDITFQVTDTTSSGLDFIPIATQVTKNEALVDAFDGNTQGVDWDGAENISTSSTNGFYTARQQRKDITSFQELNRPVFLRTPFGDIYKVSLQDLQFDRLAGVSSESEYGDLSIPYMEVAL